MNTTLKIFSVLTVISILILSLSSCSFDLSFLNGDNPDSPFSSLFGESNETTNDTGSFDNSLLIGDSRMVGVQLCTEDMGGALFFAMIGMSIAGMPYESIEVDGYGYLSFDEVINVKRFDRVYISIGVNDLYRNIDDIVTDYKTCIEKIRTAQPDATVYIVANLHVTSYYSAVDENVSNEKLYELNKKTREICNGEDIRFLDPNFMFDNENGALADEYSSDGIHLQSDSYQRYGEWLKTT